MEVLACRGCEGVDGCPGGSGVAAAAAAVAHSHCQKLPFLDHCPVEGDETEDEACFSVLPHLIYLSIRSLILYILTFNSLVQSDFF